MQVIVAEIPVQARHDHGHIFIRHTEARRAQLFAQAGAAEDVHARAWRVMSLQPGGSRRAGSHDAAGGHIRHTQGGELAHIVMARLAAVVGRQHPGQVSALQQFEEGVKTGQGIVAAPEDAVHVRDERPDATDVHAHSNIPGR